jgi:hypothetical protein
MILKIDEESKFIHHHFNKFRCELKENLFLQSINIFS